MMRAMMILVGISCLLAACGSDGSSGDCEGTMTKLCDMACDCTSDESCALTAGQGALIDFVDRADCLDWYVGLVCPQADQAPEGFFTACSAALDSAGCETDPNEALFIPDECIAED